MLTPLTVAQSPFLAWAVKALIGLAPQGTAVPQIFIATVLCQSSIGAHDTIGLHDYESAVYLCLPVTYISS